MFDVQSVDGASGQVAVQQRRRQRQRRAEVLDSSSDEEGMSSSSSSVDDKDDRSRHSQSSSISTGKSSGRVLEDAHGGVEKISDGNSSEDYDDDDDELMNPYVMNPFHKKNRIDEYSAQALLPPSMSMEMANISSNRDASGMQNRSVESVEVRPQQQQLKQEASTLSPVRTHKKEKATLAGFDPYSPNRQLHQQQCYEMEMEEEESIEFLSPGKKNRSTSYEQSGATANLFGPLLEEPSAPSPPSQDGEDEPSFGSSFSPFPKHRSHSHSPSQYVTASGDQYGLESTPLSSSSSFGSRNGHGAPGSANQTAASGGILGIAEALVNVVKAVASSAAYSASTLLYGDQQFQSNNPNNPFSHSRRLNVRISNQNRRNWGVLSYFRLFAISLAALYCVGTMTAMWNVPNAEDGVDVVDKSAYKNGEMGTATREEAGLRPSSIVLKKMKKAKQHWWSRNKAESSGIDSAQREQLHMEVYRDGEKEAVASAAAGAQVQQQQQEQQQQQHQQGNTFNEAPPQAVIVETQEDGTLLIKLPPPKTNMEEPKKGIAEENPSPLGSILQTGLDGDETMYIKLPYPQQQQQNRRTLTEETAMKQELEPPLRGAAPQLNQHHSQLLKHHVPPPLAESHGNSHHHNVGGYHHSKEEEHPGLLNKLRNEFDSWMDKHDKKYGSHEEREHRFNVWRKNHVRLKEKNEKHGPCRMTGKAVFGHNLFSDLDPEEFQSKFLTGYRGPRHHDHNQQGHKKKKKGHFRETTVEEPPVASVKRHPDIQRKLEENTAMYGSGRVGGGSNGNNRLNGSKYQANFANNCKWWDVSCYLRWIFGYQYIGGTREPVYDENSYPSALDWRAMGVVTAVHSQGSCGACWAITAVETIESANAIATGDLIDLDEEEVIACDGSCEMCNGGWPQNAYEYVMNHKGLPATSSGYDADWLYTVTAVLAGESYEASEYEMGSYFAQTCPSGQREGDGGGGSAKSGSGDYGEYDVSYLETARYGSVKGYGYATDRCICYTDGSGCDCSDQDEKTAVLNVASYGPAAVCLEASLWQDYEGGIMTSSIGCSNSFLDMNHCVAVVGYAFTDGSNSDNGDDEDGNNSGSDSGSNDKSGSNDEREGYWIVKNQWSNYWGMSGYAYVAMGENTCGILNDMTQVYMD